MEVGVGEWGQGRPRGRWKETITILVTHKLTFPTSIIKVIFQKKKKKKNNLQNFINQNM